MDKKLPRFVRAGAWERRVSQLLLVPRPCTTKWRLVIGLRELNDYRRDHPYSYETMKLVTNLSREGDRMVSFDPADGHYTLGINEADRDFFTLDCRGTLYRMARLPMG